MLGLPAGTGLLFSRATRLKLVGALCGLLLIALLEIVALAAVVPLMQVLTGYAPESDLVAAVQGALGIADPDQLAGVLAALVLGLYLVKALVTLAFRWWLLGMMAAEQIATSTRLFDYYLRAPYKLHLRRTTPDLLSTMNDAVGQVYGLVVTGSILALVDLFTISAVVMTLLIAFPVPTLAAALYFLIATLVFQRWAKPRMLEIGEEVILSTRGMFQSALEGLGTIKEVQVRGAQGYFLRRYVASRSSAANALRRSAFFAELPKHLMEILFLLGIGVMTAVVFSQDSADRALSVIAVFATAGFRLLPSIVRALASLNNVRIGQFSLDRVLDDMRSALGDTPRAGTAALPMPFTRGIRVREVDFTYDDSSTPVLQGVDVTIPFGTSVAIVGGSGAGKSTLVDIVLGLLEPVSGQVLVDGVDIRDNIDGWRAHLGMVPQLVWLIDGTIRDNVAFGQERSAINDDDVWAALRAADLEDTVRSMPGGLDADGGEQGVRLSGGQRQRIGIARALYRQPSLLVLDEATSALDNETERRITDTIADLRQDLTVLVVAHRLSTVRHCDLIVFLKEGRVTAAGTFDELRASSPDFARLVDLGALT